MATRFCTVALNVLVLSMKFASRHPPGAYIFKVTSSFVENLCTPVRESIICMLCLFSYFSARAGVDLIKSDNDQLQRCAEVLCIYLFTYIIVSSSGL